MLDNGEPANAAANAVRSGKSWEANALDITSRHRAGPARSQDAKRYCSE